MWIIVICGSVAAGILLAILGVQIQRAWRHRRTRRYLAQEQAERTRFERIVRASSRGYDDA
jgi:predicted secreted protein